MRHDLQVGRDQLADLFLAIVDNDVGLAVDTLFSAVGRPGDIDVAELEREVSHLITKYYNKSLNEMRIGELITEVLDLVRNHHLLLSTELAMLLTTLVVLEGLGRLLDPDFDFVAVTAPFARRIINARFEPAAVTRTLHCSRCGASSTSARSCPSRSRASCGAPARASSASPSYPVGFDPMLKRLEEVANRLAFALVVAAFVIGLSMLLSRTECPSGSSGSRASPGRPRSAWAAGSSSRRSTPATATSSSPPCRTRVGAAHRTAPNLQR